MAANIATDSTNMERARQSRFSGGDIIFWAIVALEAVIVLALYVFLTRTTNRASIPEMLNGTAYRPFVYRVFAPGAINIIRMIVPSMIQQPVSQALESSTFVATIMEHYEIPKGYYFEGLLALLLTYISLLGFLVVFWRLHGLLYRSSLTIRRAATLIAGAGLINFFSTGYIYDMPMLFLFALALVCMTEERWRAYLLVFTLASLNKETSIFLTVIFVVWQVFRGNRPYALLGWQIVIYIAIKGALTLIFAGNPGAPVEHHLQDNIRFYVEGFTPLSFLRSIIFTISLITLMFYRWKKKPLILLAGTTIIPPMFVLYLLFGILTEIRVFYEAYPIVLLLWVHSICELLSLRLNTRYELRAVFDNAVGSAAASATSQTESKRPANDRA